MLSREDFVFTIGYDGPTAVVDKNAKRKYGKLSTLELAEQGFFRAAYSSAVYSGDKAELELVAKAISRLEGYSNTAGTSKAEFSKAEFSAMDRLFGVIMVDVKRSVYI